MLRTPELPTDAPNAVFPVRVAAITDIGPTLRRFTFTGPLAGAIGDTGLDQRIKLLLPGGGDLDGFPLGGEWFASWRTMPDDQRPIMRTFTLRHVRSEADEFDVDFALHGRTGPASIWALDARIGDEVLIVGPNSRYQGPPVPSGIDWRPPAHVGRLLIVGDETALPAIAGIVESLATDVRGTVIVEVPDRRDAAVIGEHGTVPPGVDVRVVERGAGPVGSLLDDEVARALDAILDGASGAVTGDQSRPVTDEDDPGIGHFWDVPEESPEDAPLYAWLAGEASAIKRLRRTLVGDRGIERSAVAFMGYWRLGQAEM